MLNSKNILPNILVHGNWGSWGIWSICTKTCESGSQLRERICNDPMPKYDGNYCSGYGHFSTGYYGNSQNEIKKQSETRPCNDQNCPSM